MITATYEHRAERFLTELLTEEYANGAGLKATIDTGGIFNRHRDLFERELLTELLNGRSDPAIRKLADFTIFSFMDERVRSLTDSVTNAVSSATVRWDGHDLPFRQVSVRLANEENPERRHELEWLANRVTMSLNDRRKRRWETLHELAERLGFHSYRALTDDLRQLKLDDLAKQTSGLLSATWERYFAEFDILAHAAQTDPAKATPADLSYWLRGHRFDSYFPKGELTGAFARTMRGLGINVDGQRALRIDLAARPLKSPRAFCAAINVPDEVHLVVSPRGGLDDYRSFFHEAGHAEHFVHVRGDLPFVDRRLGDASLTETYAFLFEGLTRDPAWFRRVLGEVPPADYFRLTNFARLRLVRRYSAKLAYELELHDRNPIDEMPGRYVSHLRGALVHTVHDADFLSDVDDGFYCAQYLRAWIFEVQIRSFLMREFGEDWSADRRSGDFLIYLWERGQRVEVEDIAREIGFAGLDPTPLIRELAGE